MDKVNRFVRLPEVINQVGLSRSQIYKLIAQNAFPKQIKAGGRVAVWVLDEVDDWMLKEIKNARNEEV